MHVAADPECGDVIRGTGGFRKVRVARKGMGKSGGARVVYIWRNERFPVFLITVFPKNEERKPGDGGTQRAEETCR
jgi:hypothetical protein